MQRLKLLGLALVSVFAFSALASASAFAEAPAFAKPYPNKIEIKAPAVYLWTVGNRYIECATSSTSKGEVTSATTMTATIVLSGCKYKGPLGKVCTSAGAKEGEVKTAELTGSPHWVKGKQAAGIDLKPKVSGNVAEFTCGTTEKETLKLRGGVIGVLSPVSVKAKQLRLEFNAQGPILSKGAGIQEPTEWEREDGFKTKDILELEGSGKEAFAFEQAAAQVYTGSFLPAPAELLSTEPLDVTATLASRGLPEFVHAAVGNVKFEGTAQVHFYLRSNSNLWGYSGTITGEIIAPNEVANVVFTLENPSAGGCTNIIGTHLLTLNPMMGRLGYVTKSTKKVGLLLEPLFQPVVKCSGAGHGTEEYKGSIIATIRPVNEKGKLLNLTFGGNGNDEQEPQSFEGEAVRHHLDWLDPFEEDPLLMSAEFNEVKTSVEVEIKA